jgi:hypothetical protein
VKNDHQTGSGDRFDVSGGANAAQKKADKNAIQAKMRRKF